jgi:hypothetical protein
VNSPGAVALARNLFGDVPKKLLIPLRRVSSIEISFRNGSEPVAK